MLKGRARLREAPGRVSFPQAPGASLGTAWSWHLVALGLEVPSKGFHLLCHRHPWQASSQGMRDRGSGRNFPKERT